MAITDAIRRIIRNFLHIEPAAGSQIRLIQSLDYYTNAGKNRIWYRGDSREIEQLYSQLCRVPKTMFWKAVCTPGLEIRKIHTGLPKLIVDTLTDIVVNDYNGAEFSDDAVNQQIWETIYEKNGRDKLMKKLCRNMLVVGDGAFKISFNKYVDKEYPILSFVNGEYVDFSSTNGRIHEVIFNTEYTHKGRRYTLKEFYGRGYIRYRLETENGSEVPQNAIPQTEWIDPAKPVVLFDENIMLAVPCIYNESVGYEGRGEGVFDSKIDAFDALDEVWSQWLDALRANRTKEYIPDDLLPRNPNTGVVMKPNAFDNRYIAIGMDMSEKAQNRIYTEQPSIPHDSYLSTYITALDLCLQGLISPSTLGIDVKKLDNAEAQREKEKTTLYTRDSIINLIEEVFPELIRAAVCGYQLWHEQEVKIPECTVSFGEYANPSFEAAVDTVSKAKQGGVMSVEASVEELYGDTKDAEWKAEEVRRIKEEQGITGLPEPVFTEV